MVLTVVIITAVVVAAGLAYLAHKKGWLSQKAEDKLEQLNG